MNLHQNLYTYSTSELDRPVSQFPTLMPYTAQRTLWGLDEKSLETIDTRNVIDLYGLWSVLHKCADKIENGRRLENLSWRLFSRETFSRETFCRAQEHPWKFSRQQIALSNQHLPELSLSVDSGHDSDFATRIQSCQTSVRLDSKRDYSIERRAREQEHITSIDPTKIVISVNPRQSSPPALITGNPVTDALHETLIGVEHSPCNSTSFVTAGNSPQLRPLLVGNKNDEIEVRATSIVRGFSKGCISWSARSSTEAIPQGTPCHLVLGRSCGNQAYCESKKRDTVFTIGSFPEEGSESSSKSNGASTTSINEEITGSIQPRLCESREEFYDEAIEDDEGEWEDVDEEVVYQRMEPGPMLVSRRSLLTSLMREEGRPTVQRAALSSNPTGRCPRPVSPDEIFSYSPMNETDQGLVPASQAHSIATATRITHPPAFSLCTTTAEVSELTESLRQHLLRDRLASRSITNAALKRRHTSQDMTKLQTFPGQAMAVSNAHKTGDHLWNDYSKIGLQEYHQKGW